MSENTAIASEHTSAAYSITVRLKVLNKPGAFAQALQQVADKKASLAQMHLEESTFHYNIRVINCRNEEHAEEVRHALVNGKAPVELLDWIDDTFEIHRGGKLSVEVKGSLSTFDELSRAYSPGVARVCTHIQHHPETVHEYTIKKNSVAVISDGSAVLGLGNIGPAAAMPVMEGKAALFKEFAGIDAYPICLSTQDTEEIIKTVKYLSVGFGGINLEDISAPRCFEIERRLQAELDIPVFHDDQHGTAVVVLAGMLNALKLTGKKLSDVKIVVNGFGAGGVACTRMLYEAGAKNIVPCDSKGAVFRGRTVGMNQEKDEVLTFTNPNNEKGTLSEVLKGADVFLGVSVPGAITRDDVKSMAKDPIVFALANPTPEIIPSEIQDIAAVVATGRSDYANQVNNVLCFPGIFRGALDSKAKCITPAMKTAAAMAIAESIPTNELRFDNIIPSIFGSDVTSRVAAKVMEACLGKN
jgi:malate dehydrogenase (oxaloacetate-decarboxylating)